MCCVSGAGPYSKGPISAPYVSLIQRRQLPDTGGLSDRELNKALPGIDRGQTD